MWRNCVQVNCWNFKLINDLRELKVKQSFAISTRQLTAVRIYKYDIIACIVFLHLPL